MDQRLFAVYGTHTDERRNAYDYYATHPIAARWLLRIEDIPKDKPIWECAAGEKHLSNAFEQEGYNVISTDIISRIEGVKQMDFLNAPEEYNNFDGTIVTNPPYKIAERFIYKALELVQDGNKVCMFLRLQFLEGKGRRQLFENYPPLRVWVSSSRISCANNGRFGEYGNSAVAYMWVVWRKGFKGETTLKWFN